MANSTGTVVTSNNVTRPVFPFYPLGPIIGSVPNVPEGYWNAVSWEQRLKWLCQNMSALADYVNAQAGFSLPDGVGVLTRTEEDADAVMQLVTETQLDPTATYDGTSAGFHQRLVDASPSTSFGGVNTVGWAWYDGTDISDIPLKTVLVTPDNYNSIEGGKFLVALRGITNNEIASHTIDGTRIQYGGITWENIAKYTISPLNLQTGFWSEIGDGVIGGGSIVDGSITQDKLADDVSAEVADSSVTTVKLADDSVTTDKLTDSSVTTVKLADDSVTTDKVADDSVTTIKINDSAVTSSKLNDYSVTNSKIAQQTITLDKLSPNRFLTGQVEVGNLSSGTNTGVITQTLPYGQSYTTTDGISQVFLQAYTTANTTIDIVVNSRPNVNAPQTLQFTAYNTGSQSCTDLYIMWLVLNEA